MTEHHGELRRVVVYSGTGDAIVERVHVPNPPDIDEKPRVLSASETPVRMIMSNEVLCANPQLEVIAALEIMSREQLGCLPVVDHLGAPIGIFTKSDLLSHLDSAYRSALPRLVKQLLPRRIGDVMLPVVVSLPDTATVAQTANLMALEDIHHLLIRGDSGFLAGVVSSMDIVRWLARSERERRLA